MSSFEEAIHEAKRKLNLQGPFKDKQLEVLKHLYNGQDVIALLPTGYGKSLIFQTTPFLLKCPDRESAITIVITPLNSIIKDQILKLGKLGIRACGLDIAGNSATTWSAEESDDEGEGNEDLTLKLCHASLREVFMYMFVLEF